jgi:hypothetical protein
MIIFRDQFDLDECFALLLRGAVCHGGDPTKAECWELPVEFFKRYWFLTIDYDVSRTNKWRRLQGLQDIQPILHSEKQSSHGSANPYQTAPSPPQDGNMGKLETPFILSSRLKYTYTALFADTMMSLLGSLSTAGSPAMQ